MKNLIIVRFSVLAIALAHVLEAQDFPTLRATDTTDAVSTSSGTITTPGGGSVGKNFYCGGFYVTTGATANLGGHLFYQGTADTNPRLAIYNSGLLAWGQGSAAGDTTIYRDGPSSLVMNAAVSLIRSDGLGAIGMNRRAYDGGSLDASRHRWQITINRPGADLWRLEHYDKTGAIINTPILVNAAGEVLTDSRLLVGVDPGGTGLLRVGGGADIKGTVRTKEVVVTVAGWADLVFAEGYRLMPLKEVEAYVQAHQHLPGVPSEAEVTRVGLGLGDMQKTQMAKIEELTLYAIEADKKTEAVRQENRELKDRLAVIERILGLAPSKK